jgi:multidrug efflux system membrane fusion protein
MFVKVGVALDRCKNGIVIPESAIERYGDVEHVFRILEDGTAVRTNVTSGYRNKGVVEILSGLNENDTVVTEGGARVIEGRPVQILTDELLEKIRKEQKAKMAKEQNAKQKGSAKSNNNKEKS